MITPGKMLIAKLYEKKSASGHKYFCGRIGEADLNRLVGRDRPRSVLLSNSSANTRDPEWRLYAQDGGEQVVGKRKDFRHARRRRPRKVQQKVQQPARLPFNDDIDDL